MRRIAQMCRMAVEEHVAQYASLLRPTGAALVWKISGP